MKKHKPNLIDTANLLYDRIYVSYREYGSYWGLSDMTLKVISLLYNEQANTQNQICKLANAPKQTINNIVKSLYKNGYITITQSETNGREKIIELTDLGAEYTEKICGDLHEIKENIVKRMGKERLELLIDLLSEYNELIVEDMGRVLKSDK